MPGGNIGVGGQIINTLYCLIVRLIISRTKNIRIILYDILDRLETREDSPLNVLESKICNVMLIECYNNNNDG